MNKFVDWVKDNRMSESTAGHHDAHLAHIAQICGFGSDDEHKKNHGWLSRWWNNSSGKDDALEAGKIIAQGNNYKAAKQVAQSAGVWERSVARRIFDFIDNIAKKAQGVLVSPTPKLADMLLFDILGSLTTNGTIDNDTATTFYHYVTGIAIGGTNINSATQKTNLKIIAQKTASDPNADVHPLDPSTHKDYNDGKGKSYLYLESIECISPLNLIHMIVNNQGSNKVLQLPKSLNTLFRPSETMALAFFPDKYRQMDPGWSKLLSGYGGGTGGPAPGPSAVPADPAGFADLLAQLRGAVGTIASGKTGGRKSEMEAALGELLKAVQAHVVDHHDPHTIGGMMRLIENRKLS